MAWTPEQLQEALARYKGQSWTAGPQMPSTPAPVDVAPQVEPATPAISDEDLLAASNAYQGGPAQPMVTPQTYEPPQLQEALNRYQGMGQPGPNPYAMPSAPTNLTEARQQSYGAAQDQLNALQAQGQVQTENAQARAEILGRQSVDDMARADRADQRMNDYQAQRDQLMADYNKVNAEIESAKPPEDRRTEAEKAMAIIGYAFAGLGDAFSAMAGRKTSYQDETGKLINEQVAADLAQQKEALNKRKEKAANIRNQLSMARQYFGDDMQAEQYVTAQKTQAYATEMERQLALAKPSEAQAQLLATAAGIRKQAVDQQMGLFQQVALQRMHNAASSASKGVDWGKYTRAELEAMQAQGKLPADGEVILNRLIKEGKKNEDEGAQEVLPGYFADVPLEKRDVSDIRSNRRTLDDIQQDFAELAAIRERNKGKIISDANDVANAKTILSGLTGKINQLNGRGAPSEGERKDMVEQLLDPTDTYVRTDPLQVYGAIKARLEGNFNSGIKALGVNPRVQERNSAPVTRTPEERLGRAQATQAAKPASYPSSWKKVQ
jgi:hypothetical protein